uniref:PDZ domain-containing protein n=1 Tax=Timema cristinae TaxID=61476 RepID=A0A7R9GP27_TIMCR|nr:unnamed protein product [Timema cristinae]
MYVCSCSGNVDVEPVKRYSGVASDHRDPQKPCRRSGDKALTECLARLAAMQSRGEGRPTLRLCEVMRGSDGACGFHLSRTQWDPYPWVSGVEGGSAADASGLVAGDCVLEVNGEDVLGQRIGQVADKVRARAGTLSLLLWNPGSDPHATNAISGRSRYKSPLIPRRSPDTSKASITTSPSGLCFRYTPGIIKQGEAWLGESFTAGRNNIGTK